ncbi:MAG: hypothetical protein HY553_19255 [Elusimicrobia bacterium]|nr:hypothetical protein [Elusimicrobiota bacterium]
MTDTFVGVDVGGTWLRVVAVDRGGRVLRRGRVRSVSREVLPGVLERLLRTWRLRPSALVLGSTGLGRAADRRSLERRLAGLARRVRVVTDIELTWRAALAGPGVVILAGTGSFAYGRDARGRSARVGGLGPLLGDEGSAFWIGREWLRGRPEREALAYAHRPRPQAAIAALARRVEREAAGRGPGAARARRIVAQAQAALALQAKACASLLGLRGRVPVSWHGGLMAHDAFRRGVLRRLGPRFAIRPPATTGEVAAAALARRL